MAVKLRKNNVVKTGLGTFHRALETDKNIYYVNFEESDDNGSVKMYDRKMTLICDNHFATSSLQEAIEEKQFSWMAKKMKENLDMSK